MSKLTITITIDVPEGASVKVSNGSNAEEPKAESTNRNRKYTTSGKKTTKKRSTSTEKAEYVDKSTFKRIKSIERLVQQIKDEGKDISVLEDEDREVLFNSSDLYATLTHKTEKQLKRYQAILLGIVNNEGDDEDDEEDVDF